MPINDFGAVLRQWRLRRGISLGSLAAQVFYSKGHLSNVEHGKKPPSAQLARLCDEVLGADGELIRHPEVSSDQELAAAELDLAGLAWSLRLAPDGSVWWHVAGTSHPLTAPTRSAGLPIEEHYPLFEATRGLGRAASPSSVLPMALAQFQTVRAGAKGTVGGSRREHIRLGARVAEYCGWMWQEAGDDEAALAWTDHAVALAREADDIDLNEYAPARRALVMLYQRRPAEVIALTEREPSTASPRVRWLTALRAAQGYALAGDVAGFERAIERARTLAHLAADSADPTTLGPATAIDRIAAVTGWGLYDLGRTAEAATVLESAVATMSPRTRDYPRFGTRLALAYVASGELALGCALMDRLLEAVVRVDSATIRTDLRVFAKIIDKHHRDVTAASLRQRLTPALHR
jgi:transcriptional regulator with XRE-family HTH domain